ncbi:Cardiolipin synthase N-terminal domain-containing protein [Gillisia limnaea]|uniref:Uncharacterized protein n=1 Tax=Gillisia limnaea (strain DSM 15749 / LMG 21470 / R-8282) TaxID=865937 RepID=H2C063_GILLR|nr:hypothetical protein Gilli_2866 [Gillisia limnaea DSM 15749]
MIKKLLQYKIVASVIFFLLWISALLLQAKEIETAINEIFYWFVVLAIVLFWLLILIDIIKSRIYRKIFLVASMFLLPFLAPVFYLFQKKSLKKLQESGSKNK